MPINIYSTDKNGFEKLSNLYPSSYTTTIYGKTLVVKSVEQHYQILKALFAGDRKTANLLYRENNWYSFYKLGQQVRGLDVEEWDKISKDTLELCMRQSIEQNKWKRDLLLSTGDEVLTHVKENRNLGRWEFDFPDILMRIRQELNDAEGNS